MEIDIDARRVRWIECQECHFQIAHVEDDDDKVERGEVGNLLDDHGTTCTNAALIERIDGTVEYWGITMTDDLEPEEEFTELGEFLRFPVGTPGPIDTDFWDL